MPIGFGTEEMEAVIMIDVLRRSGAHVTLASVEEQLEVEAAGGTKLVADALISSCSDQTFDLVALPVCFYLFLNCIFPLVTLLHVYAYFCVCLCVNARCFVGFEPYWYGLLFYIV